MAVLPPEILTEILSRLPIKTLLLFKSVSKSWKTLINSPNFITHHFTQTLTSTTNHYLLKWSEFSSTIHVTPLNLHRHHHLTFSNLPHPLHPQLIRFIGTCNGVVCISTTSNDIVLYNPLTKSQLNLPDTLPYDCKTVVSVFGFGYDALTEDYKVLRLYQGVEYHHCYFDAQLYSVSSNAWKSVKGLEYNFLYKDTHGVLFKGALHYFVVADRLDSASASELFTKPKMIASFDLSTETFSLFECPNYDHIEDKLSSYSTASMNLELRLMELKECLCVLVNYRTHDIPHGMPHAEELGDSVLLFRVDLWMMETYGDNESWVRVFSIRDMNSFRSLSYLSPVVYSKDGRRLLIEVDCLDLVWYDLESKKVARVQSRGLPKKVFFETVLFVGSLVSFDDKVVSNRGSVARKNNKRHDMDNFLSSGFKLKL